MEALAARLSAQEPGRSHDSEEDSRDLGEIRGRVHVSGADWVGILVYDIGWTGGNRVVVVVL